VEGPARHDAMHIEPRVPREQQQGPEQVHSVQDGLQVGVEPVAEQQLRVVQHLACSVLGGEYPAREGGRQGTGNIWWLCSGRDLVLF
jgi:hypothetical protein